MKLTLSTLALSLLLTACEDANTDGVALSDACPDYDEWQKAADLRAVPGTVVNEADTSKTSTWVYIQTSDKKRYFACNLPTSLQKTGTSVIFNATEFAPPPNIRLAGIPIKLTHLEVTK
ncbi:hypothetical protein [Tellurirhabdus rosea]|uniref:hypothetical protein n=1 Tax=Tellurirhabdus rosea TaxID=2674997 RepID=UPI002252D1AD|nr:hypothetical protein [Tellurirhabdus rosea]